MFTVRLAGVVLATGALVLAPVVTPVWAAPHPVAPTVHRTPLSGVDDTALRSAPAAKPPAGATAAKSSGGSTAASSAAARPAVFTRALDTGRFTAAGVSWRADAGADPSQVTVQVRVRENGTWSDWRPLEVEGGPDGASAEARNARATIATQPYSTASGDGIQVRVDTAAGGPPPDLTLITVDPGTSAADANVQQGPSATAHGAAVRPSIVARPQWGADETVRTCTPSEASTIKVGFVHHTAGSNSYRPEDSAGLVRGIYAYHVQGNGWCDIGYNFLVDRFGTRFEGRYGSLNQAIIGAHTLAFNTNTVGVSAMGDFTTAAAPAVMMTSISQILGWKLSLYNRDPRGTDQLTSGGGTGAKWPAGTVVRFNVVSGHRDGYATGCPGDVIYQQLASVRDATAQYIADSSTATTPTNAIDQYHATTAGYLGAPTGPEVAVAGGAMRTYERGNIYWSGATGAHVVWGAILVKYQSLGGPPSIGFPTTDEVGVAGGAQSTFTGGSLFWSERTGARLVWGAILVKYRAVGGPASIGFPMTDEVGVAGGSRSTFTGGSVLWTERTGAHLVIGGILSKYDAFGGPAALGFPTTDEVQVAGGARSTFTGGSVLWSSRTGAHVVIGGILAKYDEIGGPSSELGFPTTDEYAVPGGARTDFERGRYIDWTPSTGAVVR
jgi:uncharacterized protein with LGFP repeats